MADEAGDPIDIVGADINDQQLILLLMNDVRYGCGEALYFHGCHRAEENTELDMLAIIL